MGLLGDLVLFIKSKFIIMNLNFFGSHLWLENIFMCPSFYYSILFTVNYYSRASLNQAWREGGAGSLFIQNVRLRKCKTTSLLSYKHKSGAQKIK